MNEGNLSGQENVYGDIKKSPKGNESLKLSKLQFPQMVRQHIQNGGQTRSFLDVGAGYGNRIEYFQQNMGYRVAIEPDIKTYNDLKGKYNELYKTNWEEWQEQNKNAKFDFILTSHSLYYMHNPIEAVSQMLDHLEEKGTVGIILEDPNSGKLQLLRYFEIIPSVEDNTFYNSNLNLGGNTIINPYALAYHFYNSGYRVHAEHVDVAVTFNSESEAIERIKGLLPENDFSDREYAMFIRLHSKLDSSAPHKFYTYKLVNHPLHWQRDCVAITIQKNNASPRVIK